MPASPQSSKRQTFSWFVFGLMASVTFVGILSELVPSGVLPQMTEALGVSEAQVGFLVGAYALASAICAIPLVSATLAVNRKKLLLALLTGFARHAYLPRQPLAGPVDNGGLVSVQAVLRCFKRELHL